MKCSFGISDFLEEISSLSYSIVFLYFFTLITEEAFLLSPCYSLELCIQMGISFLFSFAIVSLLFTDICKPSSNNHFAFLLFFFLGMVLIMASCTMSQTFVPFSTHQLLFHFLFYFVSSFSPLVFEFTVWSLLFQYFCMFWVMGLVLILIFWFKLWKTNTHLKNSDDK